mmetsp:Transcript_7190/g.17531  ORF Transcript_7190/g.17531 Transcript_7190/m.17531 type:complete len:89 (-) Transcript_7190:33-299(-)
MGKGPDADTENKMCEGRANEPFSPATVPETLAGRFDGTSVGDDELDPAGIDFFFNPTRFLLLATDSESTSITQVSCRKDFLSILKSAN